MANAPKGQAQKGNIPATKSAGKRTSASPNWTEIDTAGMTPEEIAAAAEQAITQRKAKPRNKVPVKNQKGAKNTAKHPETVKSEGEEAEKPEKRPHGRPSTFTQEIADEIVERLSSGEPLREICRDDHMPSWRTVYDWQRRDEAFFTRIADAREMGEDAIAQECLSIADDATNDWMEKRDSDGEAIGWQLNGDHVQRSKLRIETRLKLLAKWNPRKWGERVDLNHGGQAGNPVEVKTKVVLVPQKQVAQVETKPLAKGEE